MRSIEIPSRNHYHGAVDLWLLRHKPRTILCFVQFKGVEIDQLPRAYVATPGEVAERLRQTAKGRGDTILYEKHAWGVRAHAAGTTEKVPEKWKFCAKRLEELLSAA